jgi:hypothetical protein
MEFRNIHLFRAIVCLFLANSVLLPVKLAAAAGDEHWDNQFGTVGTDGPLNCATFLGGKLYVGGSFADAGNTVASSVAGYDGTNWFPLNNGLTNNGTAYAFAMANDGTNVYAGGYFTNVDNSGAQYLARWDGSNWWP